ncbi:hypothetical protein MKQ68_18800 [Chitinophaga horti]|uniref:XRE family transcriptional regulator n=1 Tax=Chitinophaga horti TaxID=2920382 RepID=A0ABY6IXW8_9BACT|nr:hypothetical protein [Chitinophaga horti]UYQ92140.1 hypothetical protein MKQ68_18800 [Chitinophaga horti]
MKEVNYQRVRSLLLSKERQEFEHFSQMFEILKVSNVAVDMKVNGSTLRRKTLNPELLTAGDLVKLAALLNVEPRILLELALRSVKRVELQ